jgi:hypothetical protein
MAMQSVMERLKAQEADLDKGYQKSYETKDDSGLYRTIWIDSLPFPRLKIKNGQHIIDMLVWMSGNQHPKTPPRTLVHFIDLLVHMNIGPNNDQEICMSQYDQRCAGCEEVQWLKDQDADDEDVSAISPKRRGLYYVVCYDQGEEQKGPQILDLSHYLFHNNLIAQAKQPAALVQKTGEYVRYAHITDGKRIFFTHEGAKKATRIKGIKFYDRDKPIPSQYYEQVAAHPLDSLLRLPNYDEVKKRFTEFRDMMKTTTTDNAPPQTEQHTAGQSVVQQYANLCPANLMYGESFGSSVSCASCTIMQDCAKDKTARMTPVDTQTMAASRLPRGDLPAANVAPLLDDEIPF